MNEIIGEKLIDVLMQKCGNLLSLGGDMNDEPARHKWGIEYFNETHESRFSLKIPVSGSRKEKLFYFALICFDLFIRFNDGTNNCVLTSNSSSFVLNEFCDKLFNKSSKFYNKSPF